MEAALGAHPQEEYGVLSTISSAHGGYVEWSGGCMAIPHVSGLAALIWSRHPGLTAEQVRMVMRNTARQFGGAGWNPFLGHGLIDAHAAVAVDRVECDLEIAAVEVSELNRDIGRVQVTLGNRGVVDARDVAVMVFDGPLDEGGGVQLGHALCAYGCRTRGGSVRGALPHTGRQRKLGGRLRSPWSTLRDTKTRGYIVSADRSTLDGYGSGASNLGLARPGEGGGCCLFERVSLLLQKDNLKGSAASHHEKRRFQCLVSLLEEMCGRTVSLIRNTRPVLPAPPCWLAA